MYQYKLLVLCMVQCWPARWVKNNYMNVRQSSVTQMLTDLQWQELAQRRIDARLSLMYKIVHNSVDTIFCLKAYSKPLV